MVDAERANYVVPSEEERRNARKALEDCEMVGRPMTVDEARIIGWTLRCLESEWGSADESCVQAGLEKPDLDESLWMHPDYPPLYPRINELHVEKEVLENALRDINLATNNALAVTEKGAPDGI